jgi:hypothetical protein
VVQRLPLPAAPDGSQQVEVINKAAIRVLAWKLWTANRVVYKIAPQQAAAQPLQCACRSQQTSESSGGACYACDTTSNSSSSNSSSSLQEEQRTVSFNLLSSVSNSKQNCSSAIAYQGCWYQTYSKAPGPTPQMHSRLLLLLVCLPVPPIIGHIMHHLAQVTQKNFWHMFMSTAAEHAAQSFWHLEAAAPQDPPHSTAS